MRDILFLQLALVCEAIGKTKKRKEIAMMVGDLLKGIPQDEITMVVNLFLGRIFPEWNSRSLNVSGATVLKVIGKLVKLEEKNYDSTFSEAVDFGEAVKILFEKGGFILSQRKITVRELFHTFEDMAQAKGPGSRKRKEEILLNLLSVSSPLEAKYIVKNAMGEMRHGVDEGMILEALSRTLDIPVDILKRANMLTGDVGLVASIALDKGLYGLKEIDLQVFRPFKPMLAQMAQDMEDAFRTMKDPFALEYKLDGARIQIHKKGRDCRLFSRRLTEISHSLPDMVEEVRRNIGATEIILEGELIAINSHTFPLPFQILMRRFRRVHQIKTLIEEVPIKLYLFDILYKDRKSFIDIPYQDRWNILEGERGSISTVPRIVPKSLQDAKSFFNKAVKEGHEGLMVKGLMSYYTPGIRGRTWLKIKKAISLDLVIAAAEWGYGRRHNWLSNYHLAARDDRTGEFVFVGKTFKGLTDREFEEMTKTLLELRRSESEGIVFVKPQVVVEVLFSDIQKSPHYRSGMALRFARISRIRYDKDATEIDTIQTMRDIYNAHQNKSRN